MVPVRRKIRDATDARRCLETADHSGLTRADWARENGIDGRSLNMWRVMPDRRRPADVVPLRLVEVVSRSPSTPSRYVLSVKGFAVELDEALDGAVLRRLIDVLVAC